MQENNIKVYPEEIILAYIQKYITDDYEHKTNDKGHWINIPSPFYNDKRRRLGFNIDSGIIFDFKLQKPTDFEGFITKHQREVLHNENFNRQRAVELIFRMRMKLNKQGFDFTPTNRRVIHEDGAEKLPALPKEDVPIGLESFNKDKIMRK
jgi:hypothetical protein